MTTHLLTVFPFFFFFFFFFYVADPATFLASNRDLGTLFFLWEQRVIILISEFVLFYLINIVNIAILPPSFLQNNQCPFNLNMIRWVFCVWRCHRQHSSWSRFFLRQLILMCFLVFGSKKKKRRLSLCVEKTHTLMFFPKSSHLCHLACMCEQRWRGCHGSSRSANLTALIL